MRPLLACLALALAGCVSHPGAIGPTAPGRDTSPISPRTIEKAEAAPEVVPLPTAYRLMLLDGQLVLVRDHDPAQVVRIESTPLSSPEHPELLPQEMAAEVERNRASGARMDNALKAVMDRSRDLEQQAQVLGEQSKHLADMLAEAEARMRPPDAPKPAQGQDRPQP